MGVVLEDDFEIISDCESTSNAIGSWDNGVTDDTRFLEGLNSLGVKASNILSVLAKFTFTTAVNMVGKFITYPMTSSSGIDTKANGGYRGYVEDSAGNYGYFYFGGGGVGERPAPTGDFFIFAVDPTQPYTTGVGTIDASSIKAVGVQFKTVTSAQGNSSNCFWDILQYGSYIKTTSLLTDTATMLDIVQYSLANFLGMFVQSNSINFGRGIVILGDDTSLELNFVSEGERLVFMDDEFVPDSMNGIRGLGASGTTTNITMNAGLLLGNIVKPFLDMSDVNITLFAMEANPVENFIYLKFEAHSSVINCILNKNGLITPKLGVLEDNTVSNSLEVAGHALLLEKIHNVARTKYINNFRAFGINPLTNGETYTEDGGIFTDNGSDVHNLNVDNDVTVARANGSNVGTSSTAGGIVTIDTGVLVSITVKDEDGLAIISAGVKIIAKETVGTITIGDVLSQGRTDAVGVYSFSIDYEGAFGDGLTIETTARQKSYPPIKQTGVQSGEITSTGYSTTITLLGDE